ncbi:uncharacterized protein RAG0_04633 [Rhynchosporium agropyri]|uniref:Uncharacterized protein n=1 Tax=Rhynchosporium agropyri TaxID=914238 RepID=A0A1E1K9L0_9HELO|nr:uncharacterized protein RAG0_04633 [Rhynchosporium agropyri]
MPSKSASKISIKAPKGRKSTKLRTRLPSALVQLAKITLKINTKSTATESTEPTIDSVAAIVPATVPAIVLVLVLVPAIVPALAIVSQSTPLSPPESIKLSSSPPQIIIWVIELEIRYYLDSERISSTISSISNKLGEEGYTY